MTTTTILFVCSAPHYINRVRNAAAAADIETQEAYLEIENSVIFSVGLLLNIISLGSAVEQVRPGSAPVAQEGTPFQLGKGDLAIFGLKAAASFGMVGLIILQSVKLGQSPAMKLGGDLRKAAICIYTRNLFNELFLIPNFMFTKTMAQSVPSEVYVGLGLARFAALGSALTCHSVAEFAYLDLPSA